MAEMIPSEPDPGNAGEREKLPGLISSSPEGAPDVDMQVQINNNLREIAQESTLEQLLERENLLEQRGIAIAVNGNVVSRRQWATYLLPEKANILIIKAAQGG